MLAPWKKSYDKPRQCIKKQRHFFANQGLYGQSNDFSSSLVWMWEVSIKMVDLYTKELMLLNCGVGEKDWESLGLQGDQPVHPKGNQSWTFFGRTDAEAETPILWPPDAKNRLTKKDPDAGKVRRWEKGTTEDEIAECHHRLNGHEFEQAPRDGEGQRNLVWCSPWGHKESHNWVTEQVIF